MKLYKALYTVIRFVPDLVKNEPINIGLMIHCPEEGYIRTEFADKKANIVSKYNGDVDPAIVKSIIEDLIQNFDNANYLLRNQKMGDFYDENLLFKIFAAHSNQLQFTKPKGIITQDLEEEFIRLFENIVFKEKEAKREKVIEERTMKSTVRKEFEKYDLIKSKKVKENHIEKDRFGGTIKFDFKYVNGKPNLIKNISFDPRSKEPLDYAKLWLQNYEEIKVMSKREQVDKKINVIFYLPDDNRKQMNSSIMACLKEASDELIDFRDKEKMDFFITKVAMLAHN